MDVKYHEGQKLYTKMGLRVTIENVRVLESGVKYECVYSWALEKNTYRQILVLSEDELTLNLPKKEGDIIQFKNPVELRDLLKEEYDNNVNEYASLLGGMCVIVKEDRPKDFAVKCGRCFPKSWFVEY